MKQSSEKVLVLFDLDGTITKRDTLLPFVLFAAGPLKFAVSLMKSFIFILGARLGINSSKKAKEFFLSSSLQGMREDELHKLSENFVRRYSDKNMLAESLLKINRHIQQGHKVAIVSASPAIYVTKLAHKLGITTVLATEIDFDESGIHTGRIRGKNCSGVEKVHRVLQAFDVSEYSHIYAYGNSSEDMPMLKLAHNGYFRKGKEWLKL